jgi:hypothetical protein
MGEFQGHRVQRIRVGSVDYGHGVSKGRKVPSRYRNQPIVYNRRGKVTDGNARLRDARARGDRHIDAIYVPDSDVAGCCFRALAQGERRLASRLAQRWIKIQVGALA